MAKSDKASTSPSSQPLQPIWVGFAILCMSLLAIGAVATALGAWEIISL